MKGVCKSCSEEKDLARYQKESGGRHYFRKLCVQCWSDSRSAYQAVYRSDRADHLKEYHAQKHLNKKDKRNATSRRYYRNLRDQVLNRYGAMCSCCGESDKTFLTLDHVNNDGAEHRRKIGMGHIFYRWIIDHAFPDTIKVLCYNCNSGRYRNGGICPHETSKLNYTKPSEKYLPSNWIL